MLGEDSAGVRGGAAALLAPLNAPVQARGRLQSDGQTAVKRTRSRRRRPPTDGLAPSPRIVAGCGTTTPPAGQPPPPAAPFAAPPAVPFAAGVIFMLPRSTMT